MSIENKVFIINLAASTKRKEFMLSQFEQIGLKPSFFTAIDGHNLDNKWRNYCTSDRYNLLMGKIGFTFDNEIACYASHYLLWKLCVEINEPIMILEDDVTIEPPFKNQLEFIDKVINKIDYLRLMALDYYQNGFSVISKNLVYFKKYPLGAQGYAISPQGARKFLQSSKKWSEPVDIYMDRYWTHGMRPYCLYPEVISHAEEIKSTISPPGERVSKLSKPTGVIKLIREIIIRPIQRFNMKLVDLKNPLLTLSQIEEWLK